MMKLKTWFTVGTFAFGIWRGYRKVKHDVRQGARRGLKRAYKAI